MKKALLILSMVLTTAMVTAQCPGNLNITTQEDIDNFLATYPDCDGTGLFLDINGQNSNITNLQGLSHLTTIGTLGIFYTDLTDLSGLDNITTTNRLRILGNFDLVNLNGLESLENIGFGGFRIVLNSSLASLEGLNALTEVSGNFDIDVNNGLITLEGLNSLTKVGGSFEIKSQQNLTSLSGLESLEEVGTITLDTFYIFNSQLLETLDGLENLRLVNGTLRFRLLNGLSSLDALSGLETVTSEINLQDNAQLSFCAIDPICNNLENSDIELIFANNALGCSSLPEVEASCFLSVGDVDVSNALVIYPNPVSEKLQINTSEEIVIEKATVYSILGEELEITSNRTIDFSKLSDGIYFVEVQTNLGRARKMVLKE